MPSTVLQTISLVSKASRIRIAAKMPATLISVDRQGDFVARVADINEFDAVRQ
jgi:hypothetical protein